VLEEVAMLGTRLGLVISGLTVSPEPGPAGNIEFLIWLRNTPGESINLDHAIHQALAAAANLKRTRG
jgi:23S rRNA (cytidine1920-2'-O)/16S rRNA (cytidine1409-2'-O)-methyltransferase